LSQKYTNTAAYTLTSQYQSDQHVSVTCLTLHIFPAEIEEDTSIKSTRLSRLV